MFLFAYLPGLLLHLSSSTILIMICPCLHIILMLLCLTSYICLHYSRKNIHKHYPPSLIVTIGLKIMVIFNYDYINPRGISFQPLILFDAAAVPLREIIRCH